MFGNALGRVALGRGRIVSQNILAAEVGGFSLAGVDVGLVYSRRLSLTADVGAFTLTGNPAALPLTMPADVGVFLIAGDTTLAAQRILYANATTSNALSGSDNLLRSALGRVALGQSARRQTAATTFAWAGQQAFFQVDTPFNAEVGRFVFSFPDTRLDFLGRPSQIRAFPRVSKAMRGFGRGAKAATATASGRGFGARVYGG
jgi:hypothetical protein